MDQSVMVFGGSAARSSAIGTANFEEGMVSYLTDTDKVEAYNGTNWAQVGASAQGLTLINTTSFSGVASQSINDVFSATYTNYRIILTADSSVNSVDVNMRLRVSGSDNSSSNYIWDRTQINGALTTENQSSGNSTPATSWNFCAMSGGYPGFCIADIVRPFATDHTGFTSSYSYWDSAANHANGRIGGLTSVTTSYTGFTIIMGSGTITGTLSTYGYNA